MNILEDDKARNIFDCQQSRHGCLPDIDTRLNSIHDLHTAIDQSFRAAGIEIAFPQRDIHVRSIVQPLPLKTPQP